MTKQQRQKENREASAERVRAKAERMAMASSHSLTLHAGPFTAHPNRGTFVWEVQTICNNMLAAPLRAANLNHAKFSQELQTQFATCSLAVETRSEITAE